MASNIGSDRLAGNKGSFRRVLVFCCLLQPLCWAGVATEPRSFAGGFQRYAQEPHHISLHTFSLLAQVPEKRPSSLTAPVPGDPSFIPLLSTLLSGDTQSSREERILLAASVGLIVGGAMVMWRILHVRQRRVLKDLQEREQRLAGEIKLRLEAERGLRDLAHRLMTAHEDERSHLARELHDDITQRLARLAIDAAQAERGLPLPSSNGHPRSIREELVRLSADIHRFAHRLHPAILEELGLQEALCAECDHLTRTKSIPVAVKMSNVPRDIPRDTALGLFRIAQESLRNVARHARASTVELSLEAIDGGLQLSISDNGVGFQPGSNGGRPCLGHASMKERVILLEGELDIDSEPGHGTIVVAWVPLHPEAKE